MPYTHDQLDSRSERDQINAALRASAQWRAAIKRFGLDPDGPLHLSSWQQQSLAQQLGLPTSDFHIDPAGNINDFHGWKGLPTAAKIAIAAGAAVGTAGAAGAFSGGGAAASAAGGGGSAGLGLGGPFGYGAISTGMAAAAPTSAASAAAAASLFGGGASVLSKLKQLFTTGNGIKDVAGLAALLPLLKSGGGGGSTGPGTSPLSLPTDNPFADLAVPPPVQYSNAGADTARDAYAVQKRRVLATEPAFDALVNQAYGMTPTRYRGAPPEGYPAAAEEPASGAYAYRGPQFG